jgi:PPE-repeat protein
MVAAVIPFVTWMTRTANQTEQAASQARAAAAAYEIAYGMTVPPPAIAANRSLLAALVATNFVGQNTPSIAATESQYADMWAQDVTAMHGYAASSASVVRLTPFTAPAPTTNNEGPAAQATAVAQSAGSPAASHAGTVASAVPQVLQASAATTTTSPSSIAALLAEYAPYIGALSAGIGTVGGSVGVGAGSIGLIDIFAGAASAGGALGGSAGFIGTSGGAGSLSSLAMGGGSGAGALVSHSGPGPAVSAELGGARAIGAMSVPHSWSAAAPAHEPPVAAPAVRLAAETIPTAMPQGMYGALPMAHPIGRSASPSYIPATQRDTESDSGSAKPGRDIPGRPFTRMFPSI